jgi:hypothetical protein
MVYDRRFRSARVGKSAARRGRQDKRTRTIYLGQQYEEMLPEMSARVHALYREKAIYYHLQNPRCGTNR